ncbi:ATP-binding protein [Catalinimonas sp. 4WD22]|uniref:sensor histidine kinase n=1 Tax=Catalinimonas locisalis TaxID=3133978 RepID=UPI00310104B9
MKISKPFFTSILLLIISILLLLNLTLLIKNFKIINENTQIKKSAETVKVKTTDIIRALHLMDLGIRGYALVPKKGNADLLDTAQLNLNTTFTYLESTLNAQHFPMNDFYAFQDSVNVYLNYGKEMLKHLQNGEKAKFMEIYQEDYGYSTWLDYQRFNKQVANFENEIFNQADTNYRKALSRNIQAFVVLLVLVIPTLFYTAYHSNRTYSVSEQLRKSEHEKNEILSEQNIKLEKLVKERTEEIEAQNEEIIAQNDELTEANYTIEQQNKLISDQNAKLKQEVDKQTENLISANHELIERVKKMEQYAFIVSHNLRSPVAQILGLSSLYKYTDDPQQIKEILSYISQSTEKLDVILKDLNQILVIENEGQKPITSFRLEDCIQDVILSLKDEIESNNVQIQLDLEVNTIESVQAYLSSIFYNLLSNAIKYSNPEKNAVVYISTCFKNQHVVIEISDNGIGIDMQKYGSDLFSLYRRFHTHVEGRGLGLYLTKIQIENLGGGIDVKSELNHGTTFYIYLPLNKETQKI